MSQTSLIATGFARVVAAINNVNTKASARSVPVYLADGSASSITLNAEGKLPCVLADGTQTGIQVQA